MVSTSEMPYFIQPSRNMDGDEKRLAYRAVSNRLRATLSPGDDLITRMVTINCLLKTHLTYFYWVGFYRHTAEKRLTIGPYQGTMGCLTIDFDRGVCGAVATHGEARIVSDTHALIPGKEHIACDPNSRSEIVLPVWDANGDLLGVFDVDSSLKDSFDDIDLRELESLLQEFITQYTL